MKRTVFIISSWTHGKPALLVNKADLVVRGYFFPTCLQLRWEPVCGAWYSDRSAVCRN